jgi:hypothetical protein
LYVVVNFVELRPVCIFIVAWTINPELVTDSTPDDWLDLFGVQAREGGRFLARIIRGKER